MPKRRARHPARKKPVQVSIDTELLRRIDADAEARTTGRSAFIASAVVRYLQDKENQRIDEQFRVTLAGRAEDLYAEVDPLLSGQIWGDEHQRVRQGASGAERKRASGRNR